MKRSKRHTTTQDEGTDYRRYLVLTYLQLVHPLWGSSNVTKASTFSIQIAPNQTDQTYRKYLLVQYNTSPLQPLYSPPHPQETPPRSLLFNPISYSNVLLSHFEAKPRVTTIQYRSKSLYDFVHICMNVPTYVWIYIWQRYPMAHPSFQAHWILLHASPHHPLFMCRQARNNQCTTWSGDGDRPPNWGRRLEIGHAWSDPTQFLSASLISMTNAYLLSLSPRKDLKVWGDEADCLVNISISVLRGVCATKRRDVSRSEVSRCWQFLYDWLLIYSVLIACQWRMKLKSCLVLALGTGHLTPLHCFNNRFSRPINSMLGFDMDISKPMNSSVGLPNVINQPEELPVGG